MTLPPRLTSALLLVWLFSGMTGCRSLHPTSSPSQVQRGESFVFIGTEPAALAHRPLNPRDFQLRSTYEPAAAAIQYEPGRDYILDAAAGLVRRTPTSRIPDFRTNILFGVDDFDHSKFPGFGNGVFFAFADYAFRPETRWPQQTITPAQRAALDRTRKKSRSGQPIKMVAFGDSITAGGDASRPGLIFWRRWADHLARHGSPVEAINGATGGDSTVQGLQRLQAKVLDQHPDLVLIGFGMNDHNRGGVPLEQFKANLHEMIRRIRAQGDAEILLYSTFPPNPRWHYGQNKMEEYAAATEAVANEAGVGFGDVYRNWQSVAARKKCEDLLGNNINHPNDFGHGIYFQVLAQVLD